MPQEQKSDDTILHDGVLPRYKQVMRTCADAIPESFSSLLSDMLKKLGDDILALAEKAHTNEERSRYLEALHLLRVHNDEIKGRFRAELGDGFVNFENGGRGGSIKKFAQDKNIKLALVEKNELEQALVVKTIVNNACNSFLSSLFTLNRRLAVVNGGTKLGEKNAAFPCGPRHVCNAFLDATEVFDIDPKIRIELITLFDYNVVRKAAEIYADFNTRLSKDGVLPHLLGADDEIEIKRNPNGVVRTVAESGTDSASPPQSPEKEDGQQPDQQPRQPPHRRLNDVRPTQEANTFIDSSDEVIGEKLFQDVREAMARRNQDGNPTGLSVTPFDRRRTTVGPGGSVINGLIQEINVLQRAVLPALPAQQSQAQAQGQPEPNIDEVKKAFEERLANLTEINKKQDIPTADTDIIDIVGLLFKYVLDDETMPDTIKATLSHLHTPYLKIALLDKKFFMRNEHPARKLLNAMSRAGSRCNMKDANDLGIVAKIQAIVDRLLREFKEDIQLFSTLLDEFSEFMDAFNRRAALMEKRAIEAARGREKLQGARKKVSDEIVRRCSAAQDLPKPLQSLLLNAWANYLVITLLRNGEESIEWNAVLDLTDTLIWSVQPKKDASEMQQLRDRLPKLRDSVRVGLELTGILEVDVEKILARLEVYHTLILTPQRDTTGQTSSPKDQAKSNEEREKKLREAMPKDWQSNVSDSEDLEDTKSPEFKEKIALIKKQKQGVWFDFIDKASGAKQRGKLAWYNQSTLHYMFVNQSGRQVAVKTLYDLANEMVRGEAMIIAVEKTPLITRAFNAIHRKLQSSPP